MLPDILRRALETDPDRPILECGGSWTTAAELERLASRLASGLTAMGLEEGDRVATLVPNGLEAVLCHLACFRLRLVIVPLDYQYHPLQIRNALGHSGAAILVAARERMTGLDEAGVLGTVPRIVVVGVKARYVHGASDDLGFKITSDMVYIHDLQATILHLLGFDHTKLIDRFQGRDFRLTDVHGHVVKALLA